MTLTISSIIIWLLIGLIAGWIAGEVMRGKGFGAIGNIVVGIAGAFMGGLLLGLVGLDPGGFVGEVVQAFLGALALLAIVSLVKSAA